MTKWTLPEVRKPLTDADIAALTRRLAGTAVDYKEMYEAAKRDAEEAEAYAAELEAKLAQALRLGDHMANVLEFGIVGFGFRGHRAWARFRSELKGEKDE